MPPHAARATMNSMNPLPMPLRIAAGLVATAVEQARELPRKVVELPVTAVSQALQTSMRLQQKVTELAIKGDRALSTLRPAPESPTWARFDEDEPPLSRDEPARDAGRERLGRNRRAQDRQARDTSTRRARRDAHPGSATDPGASSGTETGGDDTDDVTVNGAVSGRRPGVPAPAHPVDPVGTVGEPLAELTADPTDVPIGDPTGDPFPEALRESRTEAVGTEVTPLPGYDDMTLAQLRARLRRLSVETLRDLLIWETTHRNRPPFVTMLSNRITTVTAD